MNVGTEGHFYSDGAPDVDDAITGEENRRFAPLLNRLRASPAGPIEDSVVPDLMAHLEIRTRHFRETFGDSAGRLLHHFTVYFDDTERAANALVRIFMKRGCEEEASKRNVPVAAVRALAESRMSEVRQHAHQLVRQLKAAISGMDPASLMKSAHIGSLRRNVVPEGRARNLRQFQYEVIDHVGRALVLGDSAVVFVSAGPHLTYRPFWEDENSTVYLPISTNKVLVGVRNGQSYVNFDYVQGSVACAREFFIASERRDDWMQLHMSLGASAAILSDDEIADIFQEGLRNGWSD